MDKTLLNFKKILFVLKDYLFCIALAMYSWRTLFFSWNFLHWIDYEKDFQTLFTKINDYLLIAIIVLLTIKLCIDSVQMGWKRLMLFYLFICLGIIFYWQTSNEEMLVFTILTSAAYHVDFRRLMRFHFINLTVLTSVIIYYILKNRILMSCDWAADKDYSLFYRMGFHHYNFAQFYYQMYLIIGFYLIYKEKLWPIYFAGMFTFSILLYHLCCSRTTWISFLVYSMAIIVLKCWELFDNKCPKVSKYANKLLYLSCFTYLALFGFAMYLLLVNIELANKISQSLAANYWGRIVNARVEYGQFGFSAFGVNPSLYVQQFNEVFYYGVTIRNGFVGIAIYLIFTMIIFHKAVKNKDYPMIAMMIFLLLHSLGECNLTFISFVPVWFYAFAKQTEVKVPNRSFKIFDNFDNWISGDIKSSLPF